MDDRELDGRRLHRHLYEWLDSVAADDQEEDRPPAPARRELVDGWGDWVREMPISDQFGPPHFSAEEIAALSRVQRALTDFHAVPPCPEGRRPAAPWVAVRQAALTAFAVFMLRGPVDARDR